MFYFFFFFFFFFNDTATTEIYTLSLHDALPIADALPNTVSVLLNGGDGSFRAKRDYATGPHPRSVAIADLNGDGKPDLAIAHEGSAVSVLLNSGDGSFRGKLDNPTTGTPWSLAIG